MIVGGTRWVAGDGKKSDCSATVWSSYHRTVLVADANQPIGIDVSKDGKVYWSEMGQLGVVANQYNATGSIVMHDQKGPPGNKTIVASIPTRADHGNSEDGVLGFSLQPGFDLSDPNKRHVFAYYSPRPGPGDNWPIVATPAAQVVGYNQISRWTLNAEGTAVVPDSERVILRVPKAKIGGSPSGFPGGPTDSGPGHVGGAGLDFDSAGNLYLGVGDDVSPNASGHSGYAPMDYRSAERWDARKTSANTADLRGKVLRIKPSLAAIASDSPPAAGSTYSIPEGNLFAPGTPKTRPEIYAMGFRQPFTLHTDSEEPGHHRRRRVLPRRVGRPRPARAGGHVRVEPARQAVQPGLAVLRRRPVDGEHDVEVELREPDPDGRAVQLRAARDPVGHQLRAGGPDAQPGDVPGPGHDPSSPSRPRSGRSTPTPATSVCRTRWTSAT